MLILGSHFVRLIVVGEISITLTECFSIALRLECFDEMISMHMRSFIKYIEVMSRDVSSFCNQWLFSKKRVMIEDELCSLAGVLHLMHIEFG